MPKQEMRESDRLKAQKRKSMRAMTFVLGVLICFAIFSATSGLGFWNKEPFGVHYVFQRVEANTYGIISLAIVCAVLLYRTRGGIAR